MLFSIGICLMAGFSLPVQAGYLLEEQPHLRDSILVVSDLFNIGRSQIVAGRENEVSIYDEGELVATIVGFAGNVTTLAAGDSQEISVRKSSSAQTTTVIMFTRVSGVPGVK